MLKLGTPNKVEHSNQTSKQNVMKNIPRIIDDNLPSILSQMQAEFAKET